MAAIRLSNWLQRTLSIDVEPYQPHIVPACVDNGTNVVPGTARISTEHYAALLALDSNDRRRKDLGLCQVAAIESIHDLSVDAKPSALGDPIRQAQVREDLHRG